MFVDEARIVIRSGRGGAGCVSFRREARVPRGGPDGGDGGDGGDVVLEATHSLTTLEGFSRRRIWAARNGQPGRGGGRDGKTAPRLRIPVPRGTVVRDPRTGQVVADLVDEADRFVAARGGRGGRGNRAFATATRQSPRLAEPGGDGEEREFLLELRFLADVGLLGLPNAGKSTLLRRVSAAHPNVAGYPFTTRSPVLGTVEAEDFRQIVIADIPGLIEGAHRGVGLGHRFLRHVSRARVLLHVIDAAPSSGPAPGEAYRTIREEARRYDPAILEKTRIVAANKMDLPGADSGLEDLRREAGGEVWPISARTGEGVGPLVGHLFEVIGESAAGAT